MAAVTDSETHTVTVMAATQVVKTELLINVACFYIHQDPGSILFVQPTQGSAEAFSKERFQPTLDVSPELGDLIAKTRAKGSENTISHKSYPGGSLDFVGSNAPGDLASRPKRIGLFDEIDKYPLSAGDEGDPLKLGEERLSTYFALGLSKSVRTCSPTDDETSRIGREYKASDQRRCFVNCPHCEFAQTLTWANITWSRDEFGGHVPSTAGIRCAGPDCGTVWTERERIAALSALEQASDYGWRQTKPFNCCGERQEPGAWDQQGNSICTHCLKRSTYDGHAGFHISKILSKRHRLPDLVREFLEAREDPQLFKKFTNTGLAELWKAEGRETLDGSGLINRAEVYGPDDLPDEVKVITGFADVQGDRLEVQLIGWGADEEAWPFLYEVIHSDPAQPHAWRELDQLLLRKFTTRAGRILRIGAFGVDTGGHHEVQVYSFARARRGRRIFPTKGVAGRKYIWPVQSSMSKSNNRFWLVGVDAAKDAIYGRLKIERKPEDEGRSKPGYIHFPANDAFSPDYFAQLTSERRETRKRMGASVTVWVLPPGKRNEALDTFVGALAVRKSLPKKIESGLEYSVVASSGTDDIVDAPVSVSAPAPPTQQLISKPVAPTKPQRKGFLPRQRSWLR
jgi:phage terminase large subunit GpA-like protein